MKSSRHDTPTVNAGSMADIAFLLLIFFLVTTTISVDNGIQRKLPKPCLPGEKCLIDINDKNILKIIINNKNELFIENKLVTLSEVKEITKSFLDNNGDKSCNYCNGNGLKNSSDNPIKAVISLQNSKETTYNFYIKVQDELTKAYFELRADYAKNMFNKSPDILSENELKLVKEAYPFMLSEAEIK
jgi:biopolymer transport protein ExbD